MIFNRLKLGVNRLGYIAGSADGIATASGQPAQRDIFLLDVASLSVLYRCQSLPNGHYLFYGLPSDQEYMVMIRDYARQLEPFVYDYVKPATDLTLTEQQALWASWQADTAN